MKLSLCAEIHRYTDIIMVYLSSIENIIKSMHASNSFLDLTASYLNVLFVPRLSVNHRLSNLALPASSPLEAIAMGLVIHHSLIDFFLRVYYKRAVLHHFLIEREASHKDF